MKGRGEGDGNFGERKSRLEKLGLWGRKSGCGWITAPLHGPVAKYNPNTFWLQFPQERDVI